MHRVIVVWDDEAPAVADAKAEEFVKEKVLSNHHVIKVSTAAMLDAVRVFHLRGILKIERVRFGDEHILCDEDARLSRWPNGFCDARAKLVDEILDGKPLG